MSYCGPFNAEYRELLRKELVHNKKLLRPPGRDCRPKNINCLVFANATIRMRNANECIPYQVLSYAIRVMLKDAKNNGIPCSESLNIVDLLVDEGTRG